MKCDYGPQFHDLNYGIESTEMKCERFYFYDASVDGCISCADTCNPYRQATENECRYHCSAYLHWKNQLTTADDHELHETQSSESSSSLPIVLIPVAICGFLGFCSLLIGIIWMVIFMRRKRFRRKGSHAEKSTEGDIEAMHLNFGEVPRSSYDLPKYRSSSLCQDKDSLSDLKASDIYVELPTRSSFFPSTYTALEAEVIHTLPTQPKVVDSGAIQLPNESASPAIDLQVIHTPPTQPKVTDSESPIIDLQEDFDCVEQTYDMAPRGIAAEAAVLSNFTCHSDGRNNLRIAAIFQRLKWVKQFWWDDEGAKVVVDAFRQSTAKQDIKNILRHEGIPPSEFSFELVTPQPLFFPDSDSIDD